MPLETESRKVKKLPDIITNYYLINLLDEAKLQGENPALPLLESFISSDYIKNQNKRLSINTDTIYNILRKANDCLFEAVKAGNHKFVETYYDICTEYDLGSPNINARNGDGLTLLLLAVKGDKIDIVKTLLKNGADPDIECGDDGLIAICEAYRKGHKDIVKALAFSGANLAQILGDGTSEEASDVNYPVMRMALDKKDSETLKIFLNADIDKKISIDTAKKAFEIIYNGQSTPIPLSHECHNGAGSWIIDAYLSDKSYVDIIDENGFSPLQSACLGGNFHTVKYLTEKCDANVNLVNDNKDSPLLIAIRNLSQKRGERSDNSLEIVNFLIQKGAILNSTEHGAMRNPYETLKTVLTVDGKISLDLLEEFPDLKRRMELNLDIERQKEEIVRLRKELSQSPTSPRRFLDGSFADFQGESFTKDAATQTEPADIVETPQGRQVSSHQDRTRRFTIP